MSKQLETPPLAVGLQEAARLLGISKSLAYKLAATGEIPTIAMGERRKIVPMTAIEKLVAQLDNQNLSTD
ncbi:MAG: helix-turn-helix domain-containing protein [Syntrophomonas sp.]